MHVQYLLYYIIIMALLSTKDNFFGSNSYYVKKVKIIFLLV